MIMAQLLSAKYAQKIKRKELGNMNKYFLISVLTFCIGAGTGYLIAKKVLEEQYAQIAQIEIDSVKKVFNNRKTDYEDTEAEDELSREEYEKQKIAYNEMTKNYMRESLGMRDTVNDLLDDTAEWDPQEETLTDSAGYTEDQYVNDETERDLSDVDRSAPYLINDREYSDEFDHHDKISLYYYIYDDVLCDENEDIIEEIDETVGWDCFKVLEEQTTAWVRNEPLSIDYEICRVSNSYAQAFHGINMNENLSPRERYQKQQKRRENSEE